MQVQERPLFNGNRLGLYVRRSLVDLGFPIPVSYDEPPKVKSEPSRHSGNLLELWCICIFTLVLDLIPELKYQYLISLSLDFGPSNLCGVP